MDLCRPYPTQGPHGERYFFNILDDKSNFGSTFGLKLKSNTIPHYRSTEAFLECSNGIHILAIRCGGKLEFTAGKMGEHLLSKGIVVQRTVAYAHAQNGKSEHYIRTLEEGGQALLADSGLPMSFWLDAVLTRQYLCNCLPFLIMLPLLSCLPTVRNLIYPIFVFGDVIAMWPSLLNSVPKQVSNGSMRFLLDMKNIALDGVSMT